MRSKGLARHGFVELDDVVFANLDVSAVTPAANDGVITYPAVPATLSARGAEGFAGFYQAGTALDPVTFSVALDGAALPPVTPAGGGDTDPPSLTAPAANLAYTGSDTWPLVWGGAALVLLGGGLLLFRRGKFPPFRRSAV